MTQRILARAAQLGLALAGLTWIGAVQADEAVLEPVKITIPKDIQWKESPQGSATAVLVGDPTKPGELYVILNKWHPHHMSRPHFHQNDRYITVLSGTWWVGEGPTWNPNTAKPVTAGSYVLHTAKGIHWDGAKDEECILQIVGFGPAASTPAEKK